MPIFATEENVKDIISIVKDLGITGVTAAFLIGVVYLVPKLLAFYQNEKKEAKEERDNALKIFKEDRERLMEDRAKLMEVLERNNIRILETVDRNMRLEREQCADQFQTSIEKFDAHHTFALGAVSDLKSQERLNREHEQFYRSLIADVMNKRRQQQDGAA